MNFQQYGDLFWKGRDQLTKEATYNCISCEHSLDQPSKVEFRLEFSVQSKTKELNAFRTVVLIAAQLCLLEDPIDAPAYSSRLNLLVAAALEQTKDWDVTVDATK